jgi:hypothetical protein
MKEEEANIMQESTKPAHPTSTNLAGIAKLL